MSEISLGSAIYTAVKPIFKIYIIIFIGFYAGKTQLISSLTAKRISDIVITLLLPSLVFENIISNLQSNDIKQIGIIALISFLFFSIGTLSAWASYHLGGRPKYWQGGCLSVGILPNISDLPIAYLTTFASGLIFTKEEGNKGIAYICIFTLFQVFVQFNLGIFKLIGKDYNEQMKDMENDEEKEQESKTEQLLSSSTSLSEGGDDEDLDEENDSQSENDEGLNHNNNNNNNDPVALIEAKDKTSTISRQQSHVSNAYSRRRRSVSSRHSELSRQESRLSNILGNQQQQNPINELIQVYSHQIVNSENNDIDFDTVSIHPKKPSEKSRPSSINPSNNSITNKLQKLFLFILDNFKKPISLALLLSVIIAMIPWVRALFVSSNQVNIPTAPDKQPPLSFIIDFTSYLGNASIPCGLLVLGSTLARLSIGSMPKYFWVTPLLLSISRLIILPIIGCLIIWGFDKANWFYDDNILKFVCTIVWGVPNATSIIYITAYYSPVDEEEAKKYKQVNYLALCYLIQYGVLFITLPFLCTFIVKVLLGF
ncbi:hypothetical protein WICMUC_001701 [Wickerhamomyces mucosus]|uniref:Auxin efflux carrier n=1 Tax=Wickerhamomyces mucosus TaxID=1378264 RepID=A0A9P8PTL7_9ASCO|nr:hypothetical protein WICMUC_001701 [Wickerhamomyces mucosus]